MGAPKRWILGVLRFYRTGVSPAFQPKCRYTPTCSAYAVEAVERFGVGRGLWLSLRRVLRCHPYHRGGHDPVPELKSSAGQLPSAISRSTRPAG